MGPFLAQFRPSAMRKDGLRHGGAWGLGLGLAVFLVLLFTAGLPGSTQVGNQSRALRAATWGQPVSAQVLYSSDPYTDDADIPGSLAQAVTVEVAPNEVRTVEMSFLDAGADRVNVWHSRTGYFIAGDLRYHGATSPPLPDDQFFFLVTFIILDFLVGFALVLAGLFCSWRYNQMHDQPDLSDRLVRRITGSPAP